MPNNPDKINELLDQLELLSKKQALFQKEINALQAELYELKYARKTESITPEEVEKPILVEKTDTPLLIEKPIEVPIRPEIPKKTISPKPQIPHQKSDIEKFIGEKLINIIGVLILVFGVGIGAKYAIDNELISPLTRIILGYVVGVGLLGFAIQLKKNYLVFSAVLLSGAMAIMYFITFAAYSFYGLIPQNLTFGLMVIFTIFTVFAALNYDKQVIAHIGLVGAYAVPFLLSDGSGRVLILFSYMAIINVGILSIAIKKYWKALYYSAFAMTWAIFLFWFADNYNTDTHFQLGFTFLAIFFVIFYGVFLAYKLLQKETFEFSDVIMLLINSFIFYGIGYVMLDKHSQGEQLLGLFTLGNAIIHFGVSAIIYQQKLGDKNLFYLVIGLVLAFITIAIPVQLEGHWVVLLWSVEAAIIFWLGREKEIPFYEKLSYILMILAAYCLFYDWTNHYIWENMGYATDIPKIRPIFNPQFLGSIVFIAAFSFINYFNRKKPYTGTLDRLIPPIIHFAIPILLLSAIYFAFYLEIANYFAQSYQASMLSINKPDLGEISYWNEDIRRFGNLWLMNYSLIFSALLAAANIYIVKNRTLGMVNMLILAFAIGIFLLQGMNLLSGLRISYLVKEVGDYYQHGIINIGIRYISYLFVGLALVFLYKYSKEDFMKPLEEKLPVMYDIFLFGTILWIVSTELITWIEMAGYEEAFKFGLSILWVIYALLLIVLGIVQKKKHLRIAAIILLAVTLLKLFFYDLNNLSTIAKVMIFIPLGILLLLISFLYNKYKYLISDEEIQDNQSK